MAISRSTALVWLIVSQVLYAASLLPWVMMAGLSVMAFDAPGSTEQIAPWVFVGVVWSYPLLPLISTIAAWILYARGKHRAAAVATSVPLAVVALACLALAGLWIYGSLRYT